MYISQRSEVAPFVVMDVMQAATKREREGKNILHLEVGQPGTAAPDAVVAAAQQALQNNKIGYSVALGIDPLREAIAKHYADRFAVVVDPECIVITPGSSGGFVLAFLALFDQGARIAVPAPGYPCYRNIVKSLNLEPVDIMVQAENNYLLMPADLERLSQPVNGIIVSSPGNPTGSMYGEAALQELIEYCRIKNISLISDEIYHGITFSEPATTALKFSQDLVVVNSFSKYFSMTGWRVGWMIVPKDMVRRIERLLQNLFLSTSTLSQLAAMAAFQCYQQLDQYVAEYRVKRDLLYKRLQSAGVNKIASPDGAFYLYADIAHLTDDSVVFCQRILDELEVAITPGVDFDPLRGKQTMRISYSADYATIDEASIRLQNWLLKQ